MKHVGLICAAALLIAAAAAAAGTEKVAYPQDYAATQVLYATVDRPDNKTVRDLYVSPEALRAARAGQPLAQGTVITMEVYKAKLDDKEEPVRDAGGRMVKDTLAAIVVMEKQAGWGAEYPAELRNGEWEYAKFSPAGERDPNPDMKACFECHKGVEEQDFVFTLPQLLEHGG